MEGQSSTHRSELAQHAAEWQALAEGERAMWQMMTARQYHHARAWQSVRQQRYVAEHGLVSRGLLLGKTWEEISVALRNVRESASFEW